MRNLKISMKLLLGFGLILIVFMVSVFVTWRYLKVVDDGSELLAEKVAPAVDLVSLFNNEVWGVFYSMRGVQYTESPRYIATFKESVEKALKAEGSVSEMNSLYPELLSPAHVVGTVIPIAKQYINLTDEAITLMGKKQALLEAFLKEGNELSDTMGEMVSVLYNQLRSGLQNTGGLGGVRTDTRAIANALYIAANLKEEIMSLQRDAWNAIAIIQAGGGVEKMREIDGKGNELRKRAEELKPFFITREEQNKLQALLLHFESYEKSLKEFTNACVDLDQVHQARTPLMESLNHETDVALDLALDLVKSVSNDNIGYLKDVLFMLFVSTAIAVILGIATVMFISRSISKPLNTIVRLAKRAGEGDLTVKKSDFGYEGKDEMGSMITALSDMVMSQNTTMSKIVEISKSLADGASDLSAISEETNASMEEIRASVAQVSALSESNGSALEESNAGVEEMSAGADNVSNSATDSAAFIAQTTNTSNKAIQTVRNVIEGMQDVNKNSKESEEKTRQLVSSVENVSGFVSVITGIADQTNLLALNAAIEAARAGEVGRGFAVVAEEVRKLAEESAQAARNVNGIIQELQAGAKESINATTEAGRLLASTLNNAEHALDELNGALDQMNKANDSIQNIAAIAEEQAASSKEVAQAIDNATKSSSEMIGSITGINHATNETAKATEGVAKQAENMSEYSNTLSQLLSHFRLESAPPASMKALAHRQR